MKKKLMIFFLVMFIAVGGVFAQIKAEDVINSIIYVADIVRIINPKAANSLEKVMVDAYNKAAYKAVQGLANVLVTNALDAIAESFTNMVVDIKDMIRGQATDKEGALQIDFSKMEKYEQKSAVEDEDDRKTHRPHVYTWADISPRNSTIKGVNPGSELYDQGLSLRLFLRSATDPQLVTIGNGNYLNVTLPKFDSYGVEIEPGHIYSEARQDSNAQGGFFWSESSNMIYVGEDRCLELTDASDWGTVVLKQCALNNPKQMWRRLVSKTSSVNNAPVTVSFESVAYADRCMGETNPGSLDKNIYGYSCTYWKENRKILVSYERIPGLQPVETTTFKFNHDTNEYDAQHSNFSCVMALSESFYPSDYNGALKTNREADCKQQGQTLSRPTRSLDFTPPTYITDKFTILDNTGANPSNFNISRKHYIGTPVLVPLLPGQWRVYVINIGQGSFNVVDGYSWPHPVIIDMGSSTGLGSSGDLNKHGLKLHSFMDWLLRKGTEGVIKYNSSLESPVTVPATARSPILIISHADKDHYNLLEYMFESIGDTKLPPPFAVYLGGGLDKFNSSTNPGNHQHRTLQWLNSLNTANVLYERLNFRNNQLYATQHNVETQIDAAFPLVPSKPRVGLEDVSSKQRSDRPWLYFLESQPNSAPKDKNVNSLIVSVADGYYSFTAPGDAEKENENRAAGKAFLFGIDNLRGMMVASHHGAMTDNTNFYNKFSPTSVVFSAGASNSYKHPKPEAVRTILAASKALCLSGNQDGNFSSSGCATGTGLKAYAGGEAIQFSPTSRALFLTDNASSDNSGVRVGGDIVVTVTPVGGMVSKYYAIPSETEINIGQLATTPTLEYYFTNHLTHKGKQNANIPVPPDEGLRNDVQRLKGAGVRQWIYCLNAYLTANLAGKTKSVYELYPTNYVYTQKYSPYTLAGVPGRNFVFDILVKNDISGVTYPAGQVKTQIPMPLDQVCQ